MKGSHFYPDIYLDGLRKTNKSEQSGSPAENPEQASPETESRMSLLKDIYSLINVAISCLRVCLFNDTVCVEIIQRRMSNGNGTDSGIKICRGNQNIREKNLLRYHYVHQKSHVN